MTAGFVSVQTVRALAAALLASAAAAPMAMAEVPVMPVVPAAGQTTPTARSGANTAILVLGEGDQARIFGSGELGGVEVYGRDGTRTGAFPAGEAVGVDVRYGITVGGKPATVLGVMDAQHSQIRLFTVDPATGATVDVTARPLKTGVSAESLCLYRNPRDGGLYAFALGGDGAIEQWSLFDNGAGKLDGRLARRIHVASEASYCTVDDASGELFIAEQSVGVWMFPANPEAETIPTLVDAVRIGNLDEEVGGVAVYDGGPGARYLIASDASAGRFRVYDREADYALRGTFAVDDVQNAGGLFATSAAGGLFVAMDDENVGGTNYKLVKFADVARLLKVNPGALVDPRVAPPSDIATVRAVAETDPVGQGGDAADDPAIWVNPVEPAKSLIIGTDKQAGLAVYDLSGRQVHFAADGKMNNVDLRAGFKLGGQSVTLVAASDRTHNAIALYTLDASGTLTNVSDGVQTTGLGDPYGLCMYRGKGARTYVFINDTDGKMRQWRLAESAAAPGKVKAELVREFAFDSQTEGCVADDETGVLYVAEEDVALWKLGAEPRAGSARTMVTSVATNPKLKDDLEGVSLYLQPKGKGYIVLSSQGNDSYALFRRDGKNEYVGSFAIIADGARGIDGASETDGLDVVSAPMGPDFPNGALVVQDGRNISPPQTQNFKIVPWDRIAGAVKLD